MTEPKRFPARTEETPGSGAEVLGPDDIRAVMELESLCFAYHWTEEQFRLGLERGAFHILGMRRGDRIVGYIAYSVIAEEMEVMNLAVHPEFRRQGLGAGLLDAALRHCRQAGAREGFLDVKESNLPAIDLYRKFGFKQIGVRKRYYPDTLEDALLFRCDIP
ncbi:ribosomal protein S18-alanine N-acetyltransferase [Desulfovibrio aminophilus]|nr:ribosomal protein S18-alanine N-acetyltransferase [Desulfovibrio aminophilus]MCM0754373.1 ribosomal protein S18-alanine N-acetyltransferase [Desulfovibrio aminophilus]